MGWWGDGPGILVFALNQGGPFLHWGFAMPSPWPPVAPDLVEGSLGCWGGWLFTWAAYEDTGSLHHVPVSSTPREQEQTEIASLSRNGGSFVAGLPSVCEVHA